MIKNITTLTFASVLLTMHLHAQNADWNFPDFSATQVIKTRGYDILMKVYRSGMDVRVDTTSSISALYIPEDDKAYSLTVYPDKSEQCVVMERAQAGMLPSPLELLNGTQVKRTAAGQDTVEGHKCNVETAKITRSDGTVIEAKVWEAQDLQGVPVKIETTLPFGKIIAFYRDVVLGKPDKKLITPPAKCTPLDKMGQVVESGVVK